MTERTLTHLEVRMEMSERCGSGGVSRTVAHVAGRTKRARREIGAEDEHGASKTAGRGADCGRWAACWRAARYVCRFFIWTGGL